MTMSVLNSIRKIHGPATRAEAATRDLRNLPWCSIESAAEQLITAADQGLYEAKHLGAIGGCPCKPNLDKNMHEARSSLRSLVGFLVPPHILFQAPGLPAK